MRILVDTRDLLIAKTGTKTYLQEIIKQFNLNSDHQFIYVSPKKIPRGKSTTSKMHGHLTFFIWKQIILPIKALRYKADVIFCSDYSVPYLKLGYKTFVVFHGANFWKYPTYYNKYWMLLFKRISLPAARKANAIITVSEFSKNDIHKFTSLNENQLFPIHIAGRTDLKMKYEPSKLAGFGLEKDNFILHVGVKEKRKNLPRLIQAFHKAKLTNIKLVLVGQKAPMEAFDDSHIIDQLIKTHRLEDKVLQLGYVSNTDLNLLYNTAKFYVFPSYYEGFGLPILECYHKKLALLASNTSAIPEVAGDGAFYFDPYSVEGISNALVKFDGDFEIRNKCISNGEKRLLSFSWKKTTDQMLNLMKEK